MNKVVVPDSYGTHLFMNIWLTDPKTKDPSVTLTLLVTGFGVCMAKLLLSGLAIGSLQLAAFGGGDFAAAVGALGALYAARRHPAMNGSDNAAPGGKNAQA